MNEDFPLLNNKTDNWILAIDTSAKNMSLSVYLNEMNYCEFILASIKRHSSSVASSIESILNLSGLSMQQIKGIAVSIGPGSFTGLRISLSLAKGIAFAQNIPICPVPTHSALIYQFHNSSVYEGKVIIAIRVNTTEVYYSAYEIQNNSVRVIDSTTVLSIDALKNILIGDILLIGNEHWFNYHKYINLSSPNAKYVAGWSVKYGTHLFMKDIDLLEPNYLKEFIIKRKTQ